MMHYRKGENVEEEIKKDELPFDDCFPKGQKDFLWMHVKGGTKVNNVVTYAKNALESGETRTIVWTGAGGGVVKTVSCAEIIKRTHPLHQVTRMNYTTIDEHWLPQQEGLDEIIVKRKIPCIHILMSLDELDESVNGVQKPNTPLNCMPNTAASTSQHSSNRHGPRSHGRSGGPQRFNQERNQHANTAKNEQRSTKSNKPPGKKSDNRERHQKKLPTESPREKQSVDGKDQAL